MVKPSRWRWWRRYIPQSRIFWSQRRQGLGKDSLIFFFLILAPLSSQVKPPFDTGFVVEDKGLFELLKLNLALLPSLTQFFKMAADICSVQGPQLRGLQHLLLEVYTKVGAVPHLFPKIALGTRDSVIVLLIRVYYTNK